MKISSFSISTIILLHLATSSIFFIPPVQCLSPLKPSLMEQLCRKTPHYHLCVLTLKTHLPNLPSLQQRSSGTIADIAGYARITLEVATANASATLEHINRIYVKTRDKQLKIALDGCFTSYNQIVKVHMPRCRKAMAKGDYKAVKEGAFVAGNKADSCEKKFKDHASSPLRDTNHYVRDLCAITVSIVSKLIQQPSHQNLAYDS